MSDDVDAPWTDDVSVLDMTDRDLDEKRMDEMAVASADREMHRLVETLRQVQNLESVRSTLDRATRIELAHAIDNYTVSFSRDDYDIAYLIPPTGWVEDMEVFDDTEIVDVDVVADVGRVINFSTPPTVKQMAAEAVEENAYETNHALTMTGVRRQLGRLE